jgi:L-amino acid N-acyltransferase YncA
MLKFRGATMGDWARLFAWRTEGEAAEASREPRPTLAQHMEWLERQLASDTTRIFVARNSMQNAYLGMVRLDRADAESWEVSVIVDARHREGGYATSFVDHAVEELRRLGASKALATVRESNAASLRLFADRGFVPLVYEDGFVTLSRDLMPGLEAVS